jgi:hypothetical protein
MSFTSTAGSGWLCSVSAPLVRFRGDPGKAPDQESGWNIAVSADESLIEQARLVARTQRTTLNAAFREWLEQYAAQAGGGAAVDALMRRLRHVR